MPITVHHLENSRSQRILWLLEEIGTEYDIKFYKRTVEMLAPKELFEVHPLGKSPVITDDTHTIAESGAIIEYLVDKYKPALRPEAQDKKLDYTFWLHFAEGSLMNPLLMKLTFDIVVQKCPFFIRPIASGIRAAVFKSSIEPNLKRMFGYVESHLEKNHYFCGDQFSAADVQMSFPIQAGSSFAGERTKEWLSKVEGRDAYKQALVKGGEYKLFDF